MSTYYFFLKFPIEVAMAEHNQAAPMPGSLWPLSMKFNAKLSNLWQSK